MSHLIRGCCLPAKHKDEEEQVPTRECSGRCGMVSCWFLLRLLVLLLLVILVIVSQINVGWFTVIVVFGWNQ